MSGWLLPRFAVVIVYDLKLSITCSLFTVTLERNYLSGILTFLINH